MLRIIRLKIIYVNLNEIEPLKLIQWRDMFEHLLAAKQCTDASRTRHWNVNKQNSSYIFFQFILIKNYCLINALLWSILRDYRIHFRNVQPSITNYERKNLFRVYHQSVLNSIFSAASYLVFSSTLHECFLLLKAIAG